MGATQVLGNLLHVPPFGRRVLQSAPSPAAAPDTLTCQTTSPSHSTGLTSSKSRHATSPRPRLGPESGGNSAYAKAHAIPLA
eukprot:scaffold359554_cov14-Prasinocladus_malaysianus.AAC.1